VASRSAPPDGELDRRRRTEVDRRRRAEVDRRRLAGDDDLQ